MRRIISGVVSLILVLSVLAGCSANQMPTEKPKDFTFILKYGVGAKNVLNTKDGTFTKDMISSGTKTTDLKLSDDGSRASRWVHVKRGFATSERI